MLSFLDDAPPYREIARRVAEFLQRHHALTRARARLNPFAACEFSGDHDGGNAGNMRPVAHSRRQVPGALAGYSPCPASRNDDTHAADVTAKKIEPTRHSQYCFCHGSGLAYQFHPREPCQRPQPEMRRGQFERRVEADRLEGAVTRRKELQIGNVAARRPSPAQVRVVDPAQSLPAEYLSPPPVAPFGKRPPAIAKNRFEGRLAARHGLPRRDTDLDLLDALESSGQSIDDGR